jgi:hypothetical protein
LRHGKVLAAVLFAVALGAVFALPRWRKIAPPGVAPAPASPRRTRPASRLRRKALLATVGAVALGLAVTVSGWRSLVSDDAAVAAGVPLEALTAPRAALALDAPAAAPVLPAPTATPVPRSSPSTKSGALTQLPIEALSPAAAAYVEGLDDSLGIAVVLPDSGVAYVSSAEQRLYMASVVKVPIMLAVMDKAIRESRPLAGNELRLMEEMITLSDNDATVALWAEIGGAEGLRDFLRSAGVDGIEPHDHWGATAATAPAVALLLEKLTAGELLDVPSRAIAIDLMRRVEEDQRWGVTAGASGPQARGTVGVKNGWYPDRDGWWINSAGFVLSGGDGPSYTMAILSAGQPTFEHGVAVVERIARLLNAALQR